MRLEIERDRTPPIKRKGAIVVAFYLIEVQLFTCFRITHFKKKCIISFRVLPAYRYEIIDVQHLKSNFLQLLFFYLD